MQDQPAAGEIIPPPVKSERIPFALKEFGNIPLNSVSAWVAVSERNLGKIAMEGIKITESEREKNNKLEQIFDEEAVKAGVKTRRRQCVYATPLPPEKTQHKLTQNGDVILEIKLDPSSDTILVADAERYSLANDRLMAGFDNDEKGKPSDRKIVEMSSLRRFSPIICTVNFSTIGITTIAQYLLYRFYKEEEENVVAGLGAFCITETNSQDDGVGDEFHIASFSKKHSFKFYTDDEVNKIKNRCFELKTELQTSLYTTPKVKEEK